jgi:hypothetical protein
MLFKPAPETLGKAPYGERKEQRERTQVQAERAKPKVHHEGSWNNHVPEPPPITRSTSEKERNDII